MLQNLVYFFVVSGIAITWGAPLMFILQNKKETGYGFTLQTATLSFFTGLAAIALYASWLSLFTPVSFIKLIIPTIPLLLVFRHYVRKHSSRITFAFAKNNLVSILFLSIAFLLFLVLASNQPVMEDTDLYHLQLIKLDHEHSLIPGIANLYPRYGFYSCWFQLISIFSLPFATENFLFLNMTTSCWLCIYLVLKINKTFQGERKEGRVLTGFYVCSLLYMFLQWNLLRGNASSTSYDFIVTAFTILILSILTEQIIFQKNAYDLLICFLGISIPFFKISGAPVLLIILIYFLVSKRPLRMWLPAVSIFTLFVIPFFIRNYFQSGYLLFPYTFVDVFGPDWKVPKALVNAFSNYLSSGNKYLNSIPPALSSYNPSSNAWILEWPSRLVLTDKILIGIAILSLPLPVFLRKIITTRKKVFLIFYSTFLSLAFWFFLAPDPRFVYGSLLFCAFLFPGFFLEKLMNKFTINLVLIILSGCICVYGIKKTDPQHLLAPSSIIHPKFNNVLINGGVFNLPEKINNNWNIRCYDTPLPCIYQLNPYLEARGEGAKDGFRMRKITDGSFILNYNY